MHHAACMSCMQGPRRKEVPSAAQHAAPQHTHSLSLSLSAGCPSTLPSKGRDRPSTKIPGHVVAPEETTHALDQRNRQGKAAAEPGHL
ncbi:hypothetical protein CCHR01_15273 [Colletotrichum chrysophilum]|uniref:Uncharacterized protein n=1 Tax=Colletotrichum chrysophilum TaxID=1836956 RepID=A0AAD9A5Z0_9PEZI|nr:hypothetical protein CCHR01_15273 [Colletotrichum chrysophilum]